MTETWELHRTRPRHIDPTFVRRLRYVELTDALADLMGDVPRSVDDWTPGATQTINQHLIACLAALWRFNEAQERVETCAGEARRGMLNDIGPAGYEFPWEVGS